MITICLQTWADVHELHTYILLCSSPRCFVAPLYISMIQTLMRSARWQVVALQRLPVHTCTDDPFRPSVHVCTFRPFSPFPPVMNNKRGGGGREP